MDWLAAAPVQIFGGADVGVVQLNSDESGAEVTINSKRTINDVVADPFAEGQ